MPVRTTHLRAGSLSRLAACAGLAAALLVAVVPVFAGRDAAPRGALPRAGLPDTGLSDAGWSDTGLPDAGLADGGWSDTGLPGSGPSGSGPSNPGLREPGLQGSGAAAGRSSDPAVSEAVASLAPTGTLRTGINFGNVILARKDPATGELAGLHVDLARDLAAGLGVPIALEGYPAAAPMVEAIAGGRLDVALLSAEAERAGDVTFSPPYLLIEATFLVPAASTARTVADVDREGIRLAVADRSAYDFVLRRWLRRATLVRAPSTQAAFTLFASGGADALVGLRPRLMEDAASMPGSRIVEGGFTTIEQTFATAPDRRVAAAYLRTFTAEAVSSGRVAALVAQHRVAGVAVPAVAGTAR